MRVLFTGKTGFIGRNVVPILKGKYDVFEPTRKELNLLDTEAVEKYIDDNDIEIVIHSANPNPYKNSLDNDATMLEDSLRCFVNFYRIRSKLKKLIFIGSGAEYDKRYDISMVSEDDFGRSIPKDAYGLGKYIMTDLARNSDNVYNCRIFGCYGPTDADVKFIKHVIDCCKNNEVVTIRQDCYFDYLYVTDLADALSLMIDNNLKYHDYNVCSGEKYLLSTIAKKVISIMKKDSEIKILNSGLNKEYSASNSRLIKEFKDIKFTKIEDGIKKQVDYEAGEL